MAGDLVYGILTLLLSKHTKAPGRGQGEVRKVHSATPGGPRPGSLTAPGTSFLLKFLEGPISDGKKARRVKSVGLDDRGPCSIVGRLAHEGPWEPDSVEA